MAIDLTKFILRFVDEARDHLGKMATGIAALEQGNDDAELINSLFRSAHTIKGSARMVKLLTIAETAHGVEDLLSALRDGKVQFSSTVSQALYRGIDAITRLVDQVAAQPENPALPEVDQQLCAILATATTGPASAGAQSVNASAPTDLHPAASPGVAPTVPPQVKTADTVRVKLSKLNELIKLMGEVVSSHFCMRQRQRDLHELLISDNNDNLRRALTLFEKQFNDDVQAQNLLMDELHDRILVMRMLPLAIIFDSAGQLVREQARTLGKQVECVISGGEIELDRQIIDQLADPLIHLLRNAIDHGLESAQQRAEAGKTAIGHITLSASQDGGWVTIEISDDGAGIDLDRIREKAVAKGIITQEVANSLAQADIIDLIFLPGFSTSSIITEMSGRGVGMDVVKNCVIGDLQGTISVNTRPGHGTTFMLRVPLSLAVMRILLVEVNGFPCGFTAQHIVNLVRVPQAALVSITAGRDAVVIDNEFVPVLALAELVNIPAACADGQKREPCSSAGLLLVVLQVDSEKMALIIDELLDECDMVIKQLPQHLRYNTLIAGMVITGKRELVNVLHAPVLLEMSRRLRRSSVGEDNQQKQDDGNTNINILVVDDSLNTREIEKDLLETYGYQVSLAEDGLDALQIIERSATFDAILTDVEMPNMDGFTLTERLRADDRYRHTPIIIITSREREEDKRRGIQVGADAYIVKSDFEHTGLVDTLRALLG